MEDKLTQEQKKETLESRAAHFYRLRGDLSRWWILSDDEQKRMDSVLRAINKYIDYLETVDTEDLDD